MRAHRPSRGARGACFPLLKALLLLRGSSFLLKVSSLFLKALLLFQSFAATARPSCALHPQPWTESGIRHQG